MSIFDCFVSFTVSLCGSRTSQRLPKRPGLVACRPPCQESASHSDTRAWTDLLCLPKLILRRERGSTQNSKRSSNNTRRMCEQWLEGARGTLWQNPRTLLKRKRDSRGAHAGQHLPPLAPLHFAFRTASPRFFGLVFLVSPSCAWRRCPVVGWFSVLVPTCCLAWGPCPRPRFPRRTHRGRLSKTYQGRGSSKCKLPSNRVATSSAKQSTWESCFTIC